MKSKTRKTFAFVVYRLVIFVLLFSSMESVSQQEITPVILKGNDYDIELDPASFSLLMKTKNGHRAYASKTQEKTTVINLQVKDNRVSWEFPDKNIRVGLELKDEYLDVDISSSGVNSFTWPTISDDAI